ncbi:MAG: PEP-CTERM sorting domain-containing protein [Sedimentisphaerales bacterium]|nr:PEP-CTERM sorting domain-containing protein [Sedimentisphaerales bacterium]
MKLKLFTILLLAGVLVSTTSASIYPTGSGNWAEPTLWDKGYVPLDDGDEIKIGNGDGYTVTVNTDVGAYNLTKIDTARDCTLLITEGASLQTGREMHIGDAGMSGSGTDIGYLTQTGGTLTNEGKLQIGYKLGGDGTYTISGGALTGSGGRIYVGCSSADGSIGTLKVVGSAATITQGNMMYIANDSSSSSGNTGTGTIEFELAADGTVSPIHVTETIVDSMNEEAALAQLIVTATGADPVAPLLLIENTSGELVRGMFDTVNGVAGVEGAYVPVGSSVYQLTYTGGDGNDIMLLIPEPATLALLSLGVFIVRKKK